MGTLTNRWLRSFRKEWRPFLRPGSWVRHVQLLLHPRPSLWRHHPHHNVCHQHHNKAQRKGLLCRPPLPQHHRWRETSVLGLTAPLQSLLWPTCGVAPTGTTPPNIARPRWWWCCREARACGGACARDSGVGGRCGRSSSGAVAAAVAAAAPEPPGGVAQGVPRGRRLGPRRASALCARVPAAG